MGAAYSRVVETDLSFKIVGSSGVGAGLIIPDAVRGPIDAPRLITSQDQFLKTFTLTESVEVGYDNAYYSALAYLEAGNALYAMRGIDATDTYYAGFASETAAAALTDTVVGATATTVELVTAPQIGDIVAITTGPGIGQTRLITAVTANDATVAAWADVPDNTSTYALYVVGATLDGETVVDPTARAFGVTDTMLLTNADPGLWGNSVFVKTIPYFEAADAANPVPGTRDPFKVNEPGAFRLEIYLSSNLLIPVETHVCSRNIAHKDGFKRNIYLNNVLDASNYLNGYNNVLVADDIMPAYTPIPVALGGGADGTPITDGDMILAVDAFTNTITVPIKVFMDGGRTSAPFQAEVIRLCEERNDCVALLSVPYAAEASANYIADISTYRLDTLNAKTSFAAMYSSWVNVYDKFNSRSIYVSPEGYAAASVAYAAADGEIWDAPAGENRGIINVQGVLRAYTDGEMDALYDIQINPILKTQGSGIMIWGQRMLQARPSDTDRMNVRLMLCQIEPAIKKYMRGFVFDSNNKQTRTLAKMGIDAFMAGIKARGGVYDFYVVCDESNNPARVISLNKMNLQVFVQVELAAEFITSNVIITPRGTSFAAAGELL